MQILYWFGLSIVFWVLFIIFANLKARVLPKVKDTILSAPVFMFFILFSGFDIAYNMTYGSIIFLQLPIHGFTFSERLRWILKNDKGWRYKLATFICHKMIEPWLPKHCVFEN